MSQTTHRDIEGGNDPDGHRDHPQSGESSFGDSSGPLFSIYYKAAKEEDDKMVERWQKDADGILIFTGLFSAAVAALLAVTVQDLRPNSQDTSAFYLGNIYEVLADPNVTRASIPSPVAKPPPFSPPRYAVWVNALWFLSLVMSVSCALWATSLHQWARRYIRFTQPARCSPEKRARLREFFANGVDKMHIPWAVEGLPALLHLSLFLFFGGLVIFLYNVNQDIFTCVIWWIGLFSMVYGSITLLPLIRQDSPYNAPLSIPAWFLYASIQYLTFKVLAFIAYIYVRWSYRSHCSALRDRYRGWMLGGVEKKAEEMASEQSSEIDGRILGWTISALGDDDSLEKFFEAIPGFFNSKLVKDLERDFPVTHFNTFWDALDGFMGRTLSSNSVAESVKSHRVIVCRDIMSIIPCSIDRHDNLRSHFDQAPVSIKKLQAMARWRTHKGGYIGDFARIRVAKNLARMQERDDDWIAFASDVCGLAAHDLRDNIALAGNSVLLATLVDLSHRAINSDNLRPVRALAQVDIRRTLPGVQHDFCSLWNELLQETTNRERAVKSILILLEIRHLHITLHQSPTAAPAVYSPTDPTLRYPSSFPLCDISSHRPDSTAHVTIPDFRVVPPLTQPGDSPYALPQHSTSGGSAASRQVKEADVIVELPPPSISTAPSETGDSPQAPAATSRALPVHTNPRPTGASPPDTVAATPPGIYPAVLSCETGAASASNLLPLASSVVSFSTSTPPLPSVVPPLPNAGLIALLSSTTPSPPTDNAMPPRLRACGFVNTGSKCFVNAVLQLLVHSPPFWNLFRGLGDLKGPRGAEGLETGGHTTPLVDATVRFSEELMLKKKEPPPTQQPPQQATGERSRDEEEEKKENKVVGSFQPTYIYDAIKEKKQLKYLLEGQQQDAEEFFRLYLDALDEELLALLASISGHKSVFASSGVDERKVSQSGLTDVGKRKFTAESVELPLMRILGGKFRSTVRAPNEPDTVTIEGWRSLKLSIQPNTVHTIQDSLAHLLQPQPLQVGPSRSIEATQQVQFEALPPVLVIHLGRFLHDPAAGGIVKNGKPVQFTPELEIPFEVVPPAVGKSAEPAQYKLYGVLYHHGESAGSGHYTVDVLHPNENSGGGEAWLHIDDEIVSAEDVFRGHGNDRVDDRCAYMLFYRRTAPTQT